MAALAPLPYRPSPAAHASTAPSSASATNAVTPSKKQENLAAGRRRLEEFKRKKAAEKSKKIWAAAIAISDQPAQNVAEREQLSVPPAAGNSTEPASNQSDANGHGSENCINNDISVVSTKSSFPSELAAPVMQKEHTRTIPSVSEGHRSSGDVFRKDPQLTTVPSGGSSNDGSSITGSRSNLWEQSRINSSTTALGKAAGDSGFSSQDSKTMKLAGITTPPLGASRPLFVPAPPPARKEVFVSVTSATGHLKSETTKNLVAVHPFPFNKLSSSSGQGVENSFYPSSQKLSGGNVVMLDRKLVPSHSAREGQLPEPEQVSTSAKSQISAVLPNDGVRTDNQTDGINSTPASTALPHSNISNSLSENEKGSEYPIMNSFLSTVHPSLGINTSMKLSESSSSSHASVCEATAPTYLPLPPPSFRQPISTSAFKAERFVPPVFPDSVSSFSTLSSAAPSVVENALPRLSAPSTFQLPGSLSAMSAVRENGKPEITVNPFSVVLPVSSSPVGEVRTQPIKAAEPGDLPRPLWPSSSSRRDDFSMLEQHIEDLTQEKFSLQRGLDAARALAETLAKENSALTEDFNNQGALVNDLKAESERLQGEIRAQSVVVKNLKGERDKAMQDCKSAIERSQALAAEVIALEEKVLRARSHELKLQRDMELLSAETEIHKRQIISLDKDRANLRTLMEALQEEKGLLQSQIRKATAGGRARDSLHSRGFSGSDVRVKADASTSTDEFGLGTFFTLSQGSAMGPLSALQNALPQPELIGFEPLEQQQRLPLIIPSLPSRPLSSPSAGHASESFSLTNDGGSTSRFIPAAAGNLSGRGLNLGPMSSVLPLEQAATIRNINFLITELAEEKDALVKALRAESVGAAELRTLNAELSLKLEVQTQRLELAVAQRMANDGTPRVGGTFTVARLAPEYVDEGDEVVDRVLGWVMQLFPSGSSRRKRL